ncbi:uncharacterized protein LOC129600842 [Paramacrobiotus metropolitanus]|uniref:uncharacterized protein LOC129600842 n=1 Tax=Paramacrobiotus metropolitanus TaxID=2943436 RepID=UPI0024464512|nr:uncharacterized protein LOC129600842 [Paramacrobiotus metropolitanus]
MSKRKSGKVSFDGLWTPVAVDEQFILENGTSIRLSELVDFEEMTDYHIEGKPTKTSAKKKDTKDTKKNEKRKREKSKESARKKIKALDGAEEKTDDQNLQSEVKEITNEALTDSISPVKTGVEKKAKISSNPEGVKSKEKLSRKKIKTSQKQSVSIEEVEVKTTGKNKKKKKAKKVSESVQQATDDEIAVPIDSAMSMSEWEQLHVQSNILKALSELNFTSPTPIQKQCLPPAIVSRKDVVGAAETGSGKTLAFGIPLVQNILEDKNNEEQKTGIKKILRGIVITPTRELAVQIRKHLQSITKYANVSICLVVGGMFKEKQERLLNRQPDILIATPGRLHDLIKSGTPYLQNLATVRYLVIDEADRMVEQGHFHELTSIMERLNEDARLASKRQNFVFSATLCLNAAAVVERHRKVREGKDEEINKLTHLTKFIGLKSNAAVVNLSRPKGIADSLVEKRLPCPSDKEKDYYFYYLLMTEAMGRTLVFCNSLDCVRRLYGVFSYLLSETNRSPLVLHAGMHQKQRLKNLERFHANPRGVLLASDVASRGLDIPDVQYVIHYQVPQNPDLYVHRSGRTARSFKVGNSVLLLDPSDVKSYNDILRNLKREEDFSRIDVDMKILHFAKQRVDLARKIDAVEHGLRKHSSKDEWFIKAAEDAGLELDDSDVRKLDIQTHSSRKGQSREAKSLKDQLKRMLAQPIKINMPGFSLKYPTVNFAYKQLGLDNSPSVQTKGKPVADQRV